MTAGKKHLKLIKRFYGTHIEEMSTVSNILFHTPTSNTPYKIERGRYVCFIEDRAFLIDLDRENWPLCIEEDAGCYVTYKDRGQFLRGLLFLNYAFTSVSYIHKLNDIQKYDYYGLLRTRYMDLENTTTGLYLIKN